jgi:hypothetical protein
MKPSATELRTPATTLKLAEEEVRRANSKETLAQSSERLRAALADEGLNRDERARGFTNLAFAYRRAENWTAAERAATAAVKLAEKASNQRAIAGAKLELGTLMLLAFEDHESVAEPDPLSVAITNLDAAAQLYQSLDSIDFYACLLAIGRVLEITKDDPRGLYARITKDLVAEKWVTASRQWPEVAKRVDYLRGRAFFELGSAELDRGNTALAADRFEAAQTLLTASQEPDVPSIIERIHELRARGANKR